MNFNKIQLLILFLLFYNILFSQQNRIEQNSYYYPKEPEEWHYNNIVSLSLSQLPEDIIEEVNSLIYSPLISYDATLGLPFNFKLRSCYTTNIITNHFSFGTSWNYQMNGFAFAIGYDAAFWFGILDDYDFESRNVGWLHYPNINFGYAFEKFTVSLKSEIVLNTYFTQFIDNIEVATEKNTISGYNFSIFIEQPLWKNNFISLGIKANFSRFYYSAWLAYANSVQYRFIPEVQIGLIL